MSISFKWYVPNQVAHAKLEGQITIEDLKTGNKTMSKWIEESPARMVHVIFNATDMNGVAFSLSQSLATLKYLNHERMGGYLVYGLPPSQVRIVKFLGTIITQLTRARFRTFDTLENAYEYLKQLDSTLPESASNEV